MQVKYLNDWLVHVRANVGDDVSYIYRMPKVTEIVRFNDDSSVFTHIRATRVPMICHFFDLNFMRVTYRRCHVWFTKQEVKGKIRIACGEYPIPVDEEQFTAEDVNYQVYFAK